MFRRSPLTCTLILCALPAFTLAQTLPAPRPARSLPADAHVQKDMVYATRDAKPLKLDIYSPYPDAEKAITLPAPVLLRLGPAREVPAGAAAELFAKGYVLAYAAYLPEEPQERSFSKFPQDVQAAKAAIRYLRAQAQTLHLDPDRIGLWGSGHGATIAAITAFTPDQKDLNGTLGDFPNESSAVRSLCLFEGITDWRYAELYGDESVNFPASPAYQLFGGNPKDFADAARQASAVDYIRPTSPATLMVTLASDQQRAMHLIFAESLRKAGVPSALYEDTSTADRLDESRLNQTVLAFFEDTLRGARGDPKKLTRAEEVDQLTQAGLFKQARRLVDEQLAAAPAMQTGTPWLAKLNAINQAQQAPAIKQLIDARKAAAAPDLPSAPRLQWIIREVLTDPERIGRYSVETSVPQRLFDTRAVALHFVESLNSALLAGDPRAAEAQAQANVLRDLARKGDADPAILNQYLARYDQIKGHTAHVFPPGIQNVVYASDFGQDLYGYWMDLKAGGTTQRLRYIPPGRYTRGSARDEWGRLPGEPLLEPTAIDTGFWLGDSEVTQALYEAVSGAAENHSAFRVAGSTTDLHLRLPMENISYAHAVNFLSKLGVQARLPTAAEWEYACRAGASPGSDFLAAGTGRLSDMAWFWDEKRDANGQAPTAAAPSVTGNGDVDVRILHDLDLEKTDQARLTHPVKSKLPNAWGLYDMQGNVWEWCSGTSPERPRDVHPAKGGSWISIPQSCRPARELWLPVEEQTWNLGMRICIPAK